MQHLHFWLWNSIAIFTLTIGSSYAAIAKPQVKSPTSQINGKQRAGSTTRFSQTNLAKVGIESAIQPNIDRVPRHHVSKVRVSPTSKNHPAQTNPDRATNGISQFTDPHLPRSADVDAVNNLIE